MLNRKNKVNNKAGFTLVELIVVMAIIVILSTIAIPSMVGFISNANENEVLTECKIAVVTAQSLLISNYNDPETVTTDKVIDETLLDGNVTEIRQSDSVLTYLEYTKKGYKCIYAKNPENENGVDDIYTVIRIGEEAHSDTSGSDDTSDSDTSNETSEDDDGSIIDTNTVEHFYVHGSNKTYKVTTQGDLATYDFGPDGKLIENGWVFYYNGDYYITRYSQYLRNGDNIVEYLQDYGMKINLNGITVPSPSSKPGDIKLMNGELYVFFPHKEDNYDNYNDSSRWFRINPTPTTVN